MNDLLVLESGNGAVTNIKKALSRLTEHHKKVSEIKTPKPFVKQKMGMDYVEYSYMREVADKEYPGWSWTVIKTEFAGTEAYVVHGRLKWFDNGVWRKGDSTAAHRVQKKRGSNDYVDLGNDIKAANTDCIKKAFNMYLNIADDVYRNQVEDLSLTDEQANDILVVAGDISEERIEQIHDLIKEQAINTANYNSSLLKLEREREKANAKSE